VKCRAARRTFARRISRRPSLGRGNESVLKLAARGEFSHNSAMPAADQTLRDTEARRRRLDLAKKAFREFYAQCFWSYREDAEITEEKIAFVIRGLREHGGLAGYRIAAELCR